MIFIWSKIFVESFRLWKKLGSKMYVANELFAANNFAELPPHCLKLFLSKRTRSTGMVLRVPAETAMMIQYSKYKNFSTTLQISGLFRTGANVLQRNLDEVMTICVRIGIKLMPSIDIF